MCICVSNIFSFIIFFYIFYYFCLSFSDDPKQVEALIPPEGAAPGERVYIENFEDGTADEVLNPKKKVWEKLQVDLKTNSDCVAQWQGNNLITKAGGIIRSKTMTLAPIK